MKITYLGTTVLLFDDGEDQILFDAHITRTPILRAFTGKLKTDTAMADRLIERYGIDRLRAIFVSHSHFDHVMDMPYFANRCGADVYGSASTLNVARGGGVPEEKLSLFDLENVCGIGRYRITVLKSLHSKARWYNDDLGQTIDEPLNQPARKNAYKEGGSYDFVVENDGKRYLIRPSFNSIPGQLDGIKADVFFAGIGGLSKASDEERKAFFAETVDKVEPRLVIPVHWDNFFVSLDRKVQGMPKFAEDSRASLTILKEECAARGIPCRVVMPLKTCPLEAAANG